MAARTLYDKLWDSHVVRAGGRRHGAALHRPSPGARGDEPAGVRRPEARRPQAVARRSRSSPPPTTTRRPRTGTRASPIRSRARRSKRSTPTCKGIGAKAYFPFRDRRQGIVHVIGPEQGATLPGMTVVCGDSHTSTHGAFAALAFGIGTSEVEHVLATQCLLSEEGEVDAGPRRRPAAAGRHRQGPRAGDHRPDRHRGRHRLRDRVRRRRRARAVDGRPHDGVQHGDRGRRARRHGRRRRDDDRLPQGPAVRADAARCGTRAVAHWRTLRSDDGAKFDRTHVLDAATVQPQVTWGTSPEMVVSIDDRVPDPDRETRRDAARRHGARARLHGARSRTRRSPTSASTRCSSARAPTRASRTCAQAAAVARGRRVAEQRQARDGRAGLGPGEGAGGGAKASTASSATRASNGASRAARCASR